MLISVTYWEVFLLEYAISAIAAFLSVPKPRPLHFRPRPTMATDLLDEQLSLLFSSSPQEAATSAASALNELYQ